MGGRSRPRRRRAGLRPRRSRPSITRRRPGGSSARHASAAALRTSSEALLSPCPPTSRRNVMRSAVPHGGSVVRRRGSKGTSPSSVAARASRPTPRQPVTLVNRTGARASLTARRGSPGGREEARPSILVARAPRRTPAGSMPASAIRASVGVEDGQPVTTRATARSSLSMTSMWDGEAAGIHAAAQYSSAPRT